MRANLVLLLAVLALSPAPAAGAEKGRAWAASSSAEGGALVYGTPESDDVVISFGCRRGEVTVAFRHEPVGAKDGMWIGIELFSEGGSMTLDATGHRLQLDDIFLLEAKTTPSPVLRRILTEGRALSVMVQDGVEQISLQGRAQAAVAAFLEACGGGMKP